MGKKRANPTQARYMAHDALGRPMGYRPRVHIQNGRTTSGECDPHRVLDLKREVTSMQWGDVTCPKCQALLRVKQPAGPRNWRKFVAQCSARGEQALNREYGRHGGVGSISRWHSVSPLIPPPRVVELEPPVRQIGKQ